MEHPIAKSGSRVVTDVHQLINGNYILMVCDEKGTELLRQQVSVSH